MIIKEYKSLLNINEDILEEYYMRNAVYFDIEVTSLNPKLGFIWCIALGWIEEECFKIRQFFCEGAEEEKELMGEAVKVLNRYRYWVTFNGKSLDEPYVKEKADLYGFELKRDYYHYDMYRILTPYAKPLKLGGCSLKSFEKSIGIFRRDEMCGEESKERYKMYLKSMNAEYMEDVLLHNSEDVESLPYLFKIYDFIKKNKIVRGDAMSITQKAVIKKLIIKNDMDIDLNYRNISKKCAKKIIFQLNQKDVEEKDIMELIQDSY